jgi:hypothetical protein
MSVFTPDEVKSLNEYQQAGAFHPFTCGGDRTDENHLDGEGLLVATEDGWICPYCDYKQGWAHDFMKNGDWAMSAVLKMALNEKSMTTSLCLTDPPPTP